MSAAPSQSRTLRRLFLAVFLRGRSARGLKKERAPQSIGSKLISTLFFYVVFGMFPAFLTRHSLLALSVSLHASTMMFIGMFVASSAGEALFNREEADILLHRPVTARALLWAKFSVIVQISLWLAGAFNALGMISGGIRFGWMFVAAHAISIVMLALFCVGLVVVTYQLCLRWFGRERLDNLITTMQTAMAILIVLGSQLAPQFSMRSNFQFGASLDSWWLLCLPPAWFAGVDEVLAGTRSQNALLMAGLAVVATGSILWAGFGTLARDYAAGLQTLQENISPKKAAGKARLLGALINAPPLRWWLRNPITRASFQLSLGYLTRDRDVKLRVFPGIAPMVMMPIIFLMPNRGEVMMGEFGIAFAGSYLGLLPMIGVGLLKYSQHWAAADIFHLAPIPGPGPLCHGARKAMILVILIPMAVIMAIVLGVFGLKGATLKMLLPGVLIFPVLAMIPCLNGDAVPLSEPPGEAKQAARALQMFGVMMLAVAIAGLSMAANRYGLFWWFVLGETLVTILVYKWMKRRCDRLTWAVVDAA